MPPYPPGPPAETGVVLITLDTGLQLEAEWDGQTWWAHLNDNPQAAPIDPSRVVSWALLE